MMSKRKRKNKEQTIRETEIQNKVSVSSEYKIKLITFSHLWK